VSSFRVTERSIATNVLSGLQGNLSRLADIQQRLATGKQISKPADSPTGTVAAMQIRSDLSTSKQHSRNSADGAAWLGAADGALNSVNTQVQRVRELIISGMSSASGGSVESREAFASEIDQLHESAIGVANTKYLDRPIFGGTTASPVAFDSTGTYQGDQGAVQRTVGDNTKVQVAIPGDTVFGTGPNQLFTVMADIADHMRTDPSALSDDLERLGVASATMMSAQSTVGARFNQLSRMQQAAEDKAMSLTAQLSEVEDIDLPKTLTDLSLQQSAYQAALAVGAKVVQQSLLDFLR
jgi:flagellar hook-associated protein 3 FlgL